MNKIISLNSYFKKKSNLLIFLILVIGVLVPGLSGSSNYGFFAKLNSILHNPYFNMFFFIATGLNVIYMRSNFSKNYDFIIRCENYSHLIKKFVLQIVIATAILYITSFILACSVSALFCYGNYSFNNHDVYGFNILYYLIFFFVRSILFASIINVIIYLLSCVFKRNVVMFIILLFSALFLLIPSGKVVLHFYDAGLFYHYYFLDVYYISFWLEIISSLLQFILLIIISLLIYNCVIRKKRDL